MLIKNILKAYKEAMYTIAKIIDSLNYKILKICINDQDRGTITN